MFPDLPLVIVEWIDAYDNFDDEVDMNEPRAALQVGRPDYSEDGGFLSAIRPDAVVLMHTRTPQRKRGSHSAAIPRAMVLRVRSEDGKTVYYERKERKRRARAAQAKPRPTAEP